jgi:soluble lytic murein transglycosylase-like protein
MAVEGGPIGVPHLNTDGSEDLGIMQVNTRWLPAVSRASGLPTTLVRMRLLTQPCFGINVAGAILRAYVNEAHGNLMLAIGYYHSHTGALNLTYQRQVMHAAQIMFGRRRAPDIVEAQR